jgi:hypothetical protein
LTSGRRWERIGKEVEMPTDTNHGFYLRDEDDPEIRAYFKYVNPLRPEHSSAYSFGIERAAVVLAQEIGLPAPDVHLEEVDGHQGLVSLLVPGNAWEHLSDDTIRALTFADRDEWTSYMVFDVLVANHDRHPRNVLVQWNPPLRRLAIEGEQAALWLIDYGWAGLWPVFKFGPNLGAADLEDIPEDADLRADLVPYLRNNLPPKIRTSFAPRGTEEREQALAKVRRITNDAIQEAVMEIPDTYFSARAADLTSSFLAARLARIDTLINTVFPQ